MQKIYTRVNCGLDACSSVSARHLAFNNTWLRMRSLRPLHANVRVQTRYFQYWGGSMPCNNIISSMCDSKIILYFIGLCIEYCDMMTTSAGPLHVIVRSVPLGRAGTARKHCSDQGQGGSPGGQVEGPVECTGTCGHEIKTTCKYFITTLCKILKRSVPHYNSINIYIFF